MEQYKTSLRKRINSAKYRAKRKDDPEFQKAQAEYNKKWRQEHLEERRQKDREYVKNNSLEIRLRRKGLDVEVYKSRVLNHNGMCDLCGGLPDGRWNNLTIDHCHKTGKFRGMLCSKCNRGIGFFKDDIKLLEKAICYLRNNELIGVNK